MLKNCSWKNKSIHDIKNYNCPGSGNSCKLKFSLREKQYTIMFMIKLLFVKKKQHSCLSPAQRKKLVPHKSLVPTHKGPNINMLILHTVLYTFPKVLTRRISETIKSYFS